MRSIAERALFSILYENSMDQICYNRQRPFFRVLQPFDKEFNNFSIQYASGAVVYLVVFERSINPRKKVYLFKSILKPYVCSARLLLYKGETDNVLNTLVHFNEK